MARLRLVGVALPILFAATPRFAQPSPRYRLIHSPFLKSVSWQQGMVVMYSRTFIAMEGRCRNVR